MPTAPVRVVFCYPLVLLACAGLSACLCGDGVCRGLETPQNCPADCVPPAVCGSGSVEAGEMCDDGPADSAACDFDNGLSTHACTPAVCGDGYTNTAAGETCETTTDAAGCDYDGGTGGQACTSSACGDAYPNLAAGEACDDGGADSSACNYADGGGPYACTVATCGDGYTNAAAGEACDDGPTDSVGCDFDGGMSNHACTPAVCGDGYTNTLAGETCETTADTADCDYDGAAGAQACTSSACGDAYPNLAAGEACDDGGEDSATCNYDGGVGTYACTPAACGDGYVNNAAGESCDDANAEWQDACHPVCTSIAPVSPLNADAAYDFTYERDPQVATDGAGTWIAVWTTDSALGGLGSDYDVLVSRSTDGGVTWTAAAPLNPNATSGSEWDAVPEIATDGAGNWIVAWSSGDTLGGTTGVDLDLVFCRSTDNGQTWSLPALLNAGGATDSSTNEYAVRIVAGGGGVWIAIWRSLYTLGGTIGSDPDVLFTRSVDGGQTWSPEAALNTNAATDTGFDFDLQLATDGAGGWITVWSSNEPAGGIGSDYDVLFARSTDGGTTWTPPAPLDTNADLDVGDDVVPRLAQGGAGTWIVVWESEDSLAGSIGTDDDVLFARSTDGGVSFSAPSPLNTNAPSDSSWDRAPDIATDGAGNWVAVWVSNNSFGGTIGPDPDVLVSRSTDDGLTWTAPAVLESGAAFAGGFDDVPRLEADAGGVWIVVIESQIPYGSEAGATDVVFARSTDTGVTWTPPAALDPIRASDGGYIEAWPQLAGDGTGTWVAVWHSKNNLLNNLGPDGDILFARSTDAGSTWNLPAPLNTGATSDSTYDDLPSVATDGLGTWIATWTGSVDSDFDILFVRSNDGGLSWTPSAPLNTNAASDSGADTEPHVVTDGTGVWIAAWHSWESLGGTLGFDSDILVARSTDSGVTWSAPAALNTDATFDVSRYDFAAHLATNGAGNWVAVWEAFGGSGGPDDDVFVSRSGDQGATWSSPAHLKNGALTDLGDDTTPAITTDGAGVWVAVWTSTDSLGGTVGGDADIFVSRSLNNGASWTAASTLNHYAGSDSAEDIAPAILTDRKGNWFVVWSSRHDLDGSIGEDPDIFVARSFDAGQSWTDAAPLDSAAATSVGQDRAPQLATDGAGTWLVGWWSDDTLGFQIGNDWDILFTTFTLPE